MFFQKTVNSSMMRGKGNEFAEGEWDKERKAEWEGGEGEEGRQARRRGAEQTREKIEGEKEPIFACRL